MQLFSHDDKATALGRAPLFKNLTRSELVELAKVTEDLEFDEGKVLAREGEIGREFFVLLSGEVSVVAGGQEVNVLREGQWFGELAIIDPAPRDATVTATTDCELLLIDSRRFRPLLEEVPVLAHKIMISLARRLRQADQRVWLG